MTGPCTGWTLGEWQRAYLGGAITPTALRDYVARLPIQDPAWITVADGARLAAQFAELEDRLATDGRGLLPLYGIPFAVKDNIDVAGWPTTAACPEFHYIAHATAPVVARLQAAGAILIGKTNMDQFATGLSGTRSPYGLVPNALNPAYISGGSSSGSASVVARGFVPFALGTDTAGSGRVPAGFNNIVGLKPTRGWWSTRGVVPACRTLDCVSVFALTVADAAEISAIVAGPDPDDPYSREDPQRTAPRPCDPMTLAIPDVLEFFGDRHAARAFAATVEALRTLGAHIETIDFAPFRALADLLYQGPWVAERIAPLASFLKQQPAALHSAVRTALAGAMNFSACDAFAGEHERARLSTLVAKTLRGFDALLVPTAPTIYTIADMAGDPQGRNTRLGFYTNFVNLADQCALAVPGVFREDGLAAGVTFIAPAWHDQALTVLGQALERELAAPLGATGRRFLRPPQARPTLSRSVSLAVVGAHMRGLSLNGALTQRHAVFCECTRTAPCYRLYALPGAPVRPCLVREALGASIEVEIWDIPLGSFGALVAEIPAPLAIGTVALADGRSVKGFIAEAFAVQGLTDVTAWGGWRAYLENRGATDP
ncbi:allophanate hydrolase [Acidiferrobacter sp.]|jgi:allophanate hydrolase|uniref:allophanate hydrolase n=1 Tax=Acidiferrobacter sp. TaxID=1872107 RepID=UPI0026227790|nr:allophanate hydrolase [Acidiferrobacter sp.]